MALTPHIHCMDKIHWFIEDLGARIVSQTGIPSDRYHLGKLILQSLKDDPDFVSQIDGATGQSETNQSVLQRSVQCAVALTKMGLKKGDVMILMGENHLDVAISFYAALYLGIIAYNLDMELTEDMLAHVFRYSQPKALICQNVKLHDIKNAVKLYGQEVKLITFDDNDEDVLKFSTLIRDCNDKEMIKNFRPVDFDPEETIALITETSGTTGAPKGAAHTHKSLQIASVAGWIEFDKFPTPVKTSLIITPLSWMSAALQCLFLPVVRVTRIQSSKQSTKQHVCELIDKYKPKLFLTTSSFMLALLEYKDKYDFNGFEGIRLGGSLVSKNDFDFIKKSLPHAHVTIRYGVTEVGGRTFYSRAPPFGSLGQPIGAHSYRLIDVKTQKDITEANIQGELWLKGPGLFKHYYNDPKTTSEVFSDDGWFKTGDIMYRDENYNFYFVDRLKLIISYNNHQISPLEIERVISQHRSVKDVIVTAVTDFQRDELPCACVVLKDGHHATEQEIKDFVKDNLPDPKHLRGGVIFLKEIPMTPHHKFDRRKINKIVDSMKSHILREAS